MVSCILLLTFSIVFPWCKTFDSKTVTQGGFTLLTVTYDLWVNVCMTQRKSLLEVNRYYQEFLSHTILKHTALWHLIKEENSSGVGSVCVCVCVDYNIRWNYGGRGLFHACVSLNVAHSSPGSEFLRNNGWFCNRVRPE